MKQRQRIITTRAREEFQPTKLEHLKPDAWRAASGADTLAED